MDAVAESCHCGPVRKLCDGNLRKRLAFRLVSTHGDPTGGTGLARRDNNVDQMLGVLKRRMQRRHS
jgi:hypothetical protein